MHPAHPERCDPPTGPGSAARLVAVAALLLSTSGCLFLADGGGDGDGVESGYAPIIRDAFPSDSGSQLIPSDSALTFSAAGSDPDSLYLEWDWRQDGEILALGSSEDGSFDSALEVPGSAELSGEFSELRFAVTDGSYETAVFWSVSFE